MSFVPKKYSNCHNHRHHHQLLSPVVVVDEHRGSSNNGKDGATPTIRHFRELFATKKPRLVL